MTGPRLPARQGAHSCEQFTGRVEALSDPLIMKGSGARAHAHTYIHTLLTGVELHAHTHLRVHRHTQGSLWRLEGMSRS